MSYRTIKGLQSNEMFASAIQRLYLSINDSSQKSLLGDREIVYLLSCALVLLKAYDLDHVYKSYAEFAYSIILQCSLLIGYYEPLYDFAVNFGFYPIASLLANGGLVNLESVVDELSGRHIDESFRHNNIIETYDQQKMRMAISDDSDLNELCLVAPTSYGKSSLIINDIRLNSDRFKKFAIIVPTKSLLAQTYRIIKTEFENRKIILHDEMYMDDDNFIAILTQERASRLLAKHQALSFDKMYIDEAHNLFNKDSRVIILARLIRLNRHRNSSSKITYLSPLISNSDNLKQSIDQDIVEQRIDFNMKEPVYYNFGLQGDVSVYCRFLDMFYNLDTKYGDMFDYIYKNSTQKNFIYLYSPKRIEEFSFELIKELNDIDDAEINEIIKNLSEHVHEDFSIINCLKKGVVYLHARMPDNIKEYLEYKFSSVGSIKYLIANRVVLEGVNLPIDSLFILNTYNMHNKDLTNLVGRVNRLNKIFSHSDNIAMLLPKIHFVNSENYNRTKSNMQRIIRTLRTGLTDDEVENPLLYEFDINQYNPDRDQKKIEEANKVIKEQDIINNEPENEIEQFKKSMIIVGLSSIYKISTLLCETILNRIKNVKYENNIMETIYNIFIKDITEYIVDNEFKRLNSIGTRMYYERFINDFRNLPFKQSINKQVASFISTIKDPKKNSVIYMGERLGEQLNPNGGILKLYVDLSSKTKPELVNLSIAKLKIENDFVNYKLTMILQIMFDYEVLGNDDYNRIVYGTDDENKLKLIRLGLSLGVITRLESDEQLSNLRVNINNQIEANQTFIDYMETLDDLTIYELKKVL